MSFFATLKGAIANLASDAEKALGRVTSKGTLTRVCQAAYLIAAADGKVDDNEKVMLGKVVARKLPHFKPTEIIREFDAASDECAFSAVAGKISLMENIQKAAGTEDARVIMLAVLAVANADDEFSPSEQTVAGEICRALSLSPREYGL